MQILFLRVRHTKSERERGREKREEWEGRRGRERGWKETKEKERERKERKRNITFYHLPNTFGSAGNAYNLRFPSVISTIVSSPIVLVLWLSCGEICRNESVGGRSKGWQNLHVK